MTQRNAKKLHNEDEIIFKGTGQVLTVIEVEDDSLHRDIFIRCDDGNLYHHREVK